MEKAFQMSSDEPETTVLPVSRRKQSYNLSEFHYSPYWRNSPLSRDRDRLGPLMPSPSGETWLLETKPHPHLQEVMEESEAFMANPVRKGDGGTCTDRLTLLRAEVMVGFQHLNFSRFESYFAGKGCESVQRTKMYIASLSYSTSSSSEINDIDFFAPYLP
ncbi:hypothetical protein MJT46_002049 [Ovis ammon polii x Ovis aries]|nr:hypothetical protein MJT46_002049 [Ovis ammon polii x Ovis aries]